MVTLRRDFRPEVQALRAVAVALVVVYHLRGSALPGGFIGVDVFFVISGFLITSHLVREVRDTGTVRLRAFWARRIRRIIPAAATVLVATAVAVMLVMPRAAWPDWLQQIMAGGLYVQNWGLARSAVDYLSASAPPSPVQHYWSLSVEEQFYIVWPVVVLVVARVSRSARAILVALAVVLVASFAMSVLWTAASPESAYFVTPTRAWEFAAGGLLAFLPERMWERQFGVVVSTLVSWGGLAVIAASALLLSGADPYPGSLAALPVVGAAMFIAAGNPRSQWSPSALVEFGPVQALGSHSYSIYLWHWPIIVLLPYATDLQPSTTAGTAAVVVLAVLLAVATKLAVEDPVRRARGLLGSRRAAFVLMGAATAVVLAVAGAPVGAIRIELAAFQASVADPLAHGRECAGALVMENACPRPFALAADVDPALGSLDTYAEAGPAWTRYGVDDEGACPTSGRECVLGSRTAFTRTIALVGDSHAFMLAGALDDYASAHHWRVLLYALHACSGFEDAAMPDARAPGVTDPAEIAGCRRWASATRESLEARRDVQAVVFINRSAGYQIPASLIDADWRALQRSGKTVIALRDVPGMPEVDGPDPVYAPQCVSAHQHEYDPCAWRPHRGTDIMTRAVSAMRGSVAMVDLAPLMCTEALCHTVVGGLIVYADSNHLSYSFAQTAAPWLGARLAAELDR